MNRIELFMDMHPGYFEQDRIRSLPKDRCFEELTLDLRKHPLQLPEAPCPSRITFGEYCGPLGSLQDQVRKVNEEWVRYFNEGDRFFCAFDGERIVSFCILDDMGCHLGLRIGGPGCVGTVPEYRRQGIGLQMIRRATLLFQTEGYDLSYIHYTEVGPWYAKLGYETLVRWNHAGILWPGKEA